MRSCAHTSLRPSGARDLWLNVAVREWAWNGIDVSMVGLTAASLAMMLLRVYGDSDSVDLVASNSINDQLLGLAGLTVFLKVRHATHGPANGRSQWRCVDMQYLCSVVITDADAVLANIPYFRCDGI